MFKFQKQNAHGIRWVNNDKLHVRVAYNVGDEDKHGPFVGTSNSATNLAIGWGWESSNMPNGYLHSSSGSGQPNFT